MSRQNFASNDAGFPTTRLRRLRGHPAIRSFAQTVSISPKNFVLPLFVRSGNNVRRPIESLPGHAQLSPDLIADEARCAYDLGLGGIILFGIPDEKDATGSRSWSEHGVVQQAVRAAKNAAPDLLVITDVCFCEYMDHGHCGVVGEQAGETDVINDVTLEWLARQALSHANAGADLIAPSGMIDGMVGAIRTALDGEGYAQTPILSYAAKYASAFYGPFREAAECAPKFGDRRTYQMDPAADTGQAIREVGLDLAEGADIIMVKPATPYLDILTHIGQCFPGVPLAAYCVSGEYSMVKAAAANGWIDEAAIAVEMMTAIRRAGATMILTYWAKDLVEWMA